MAVIPDNRPVIGKDLDTLRRHHGLMTADACYLFGLAATNWAEIVRQTDKATGEPNAERPLKDPSLALLARFIDRHPEVVQLFRAPRPQDLLTAMNKVAINIDQKRFSVMFGNEGSGGYRWIKTESRMTPAVTRLMHYMNLGISEDRSDEDRWGFLKEWYDMVLTESRARGIADIYLLGKWNPNALVRRKEQPSGVGDSEFQLERYSPDVLARTVAKSASDATESFLESATAEKPKRRTRNAGLAAPVPTAPAKKAAARRIRKAESV
jgi:hypothetical protein